jgi:hypothetical protein
MSRSRQSHERATEFLRSRGWVPIETETGGAALWRRPRGGLNLSLAHALRIAGYRARTSVEQAHTMRTHLRNDGTRCGYTTPPAGKQCSKCGCVIGKTPADDVVWVRAEDRPEPTANERILQALDTAHAALVDAGVLLDPASTSTARLAQACTLLRGVQTVVRRRKTK